MDQITPASAYVWALIAAAFFFLVAVVAANLILYKPSNPGTTKRRVWFWICCILAVIAGFAINFIIYKGIDVPSIASSYLKASCIAAGIALVAYIIVGFVVSKIFSSSKIGTWF